jgi:hypothetical protein
MIEIVAGSKRTMDNSSVACYRELLNLWKLDEGKIIYCLLERHYVCTIRIKARTFYPRFAQLYTARPRYDDLSSKRLLSEILLTGGRESQFVLLPCVQDSSYAELNRITFRVTRE